MRFTSKLAIALAAVALGMAATSDEASDPVVKARQELMSRIGGDAKLLGDMAKGAVAFDAAQARAAAASIAASAEDIPVVFKEAADDPKSEAKPVIWQEFGTFTERADALNAAAAAAGVQIADAGDLGQAMQQIGGACLDCHRTYKE